MILALWTQEKLKLLHYTINTDGYISKETNVVSTNFYGLDITNAETAISNMYQNQAITTSFTLSYTPACVGNFSGKLSIYTNNFNDANISIPLTANIVANENISLPNCSSDNPVITVTSTPENIIKQGTVQGQGVVQGQGDSYYINLNDIANTNQVTITALSDTILPNNSDTAMQSEFNISTRSWRLQNNQVSAHAEIIFNSEECSGPASERVLVDGLDGTAAASYLYIFATGTAVDGPACSNKYQLVTE